MSYEYLRLLTNPRLVVVYAHPACYGAMEDRSMLEEAMGKLQTYYKTHEDLRDDLLECGVSECEVHKIADFLTELQDGSFYVGDGKLQFVELGQEMEYGFKLEV